MTHQPQERKLSVELASHHAFQVELDVGGAAQAGVVAEEAELQAVADEAPGVVAGAVEKLLHRAMRAALGLAGAVAPAVQPLAEGDQVIVCMVQTNDAGVV